MFLGSNQKGRLCIGKATKKDDISIAFVYVCSFI